MIWRNNSDQYGIIAKGIHWLSALIVLCLLPLGFYMVSLDSSPFKLDLYWWHKSFGTLIFFLVLMRLGWRFLNPVPVHIRTHKRWERTLAGIVHVLLYIGMIGMPLSGIIMSAASDFPRPFFGLFSIPDFIPGKNEALFDFSRKTHEIFAFCLLAAVGLHGLGAFKHHLIDRDITLRRMLPDVFPGFGAAFVTLIFAVLVGGTSLLAAQHLLSKNKPVPEVREVRQVQQEKLNVPSDIAQWAIIKDQSRVEFKVTVQGEDFQGRFTDFDGEVIFDPERLEESRVTMRVSVASVASGSDERDEYIVAPVWLDAESFPESEFTAEKFEKTAENQYVAHGNLRLRDVSLPVDVPFTLRMMQDAEGKIWADMKGSFEIKRLDYGLGGEAWQNTNIVANAVQISVTLKTERL